MEKKARLIAMYLPQFHPIPENDEWWGKGFTEWTNVAMAKPLYKGHYQPKVPADLGFYDLRLPEVREKQAEMAREAGVEGFMYWHYWFGNGRRLLERPFNEVLASGKPDFPFCLGWANHSWSRKTWTAKNNEGKSMMLMEQLYPGVEDYTNHFYAVLPAFKDPRYITVDGKPFFLIFDVLMVPDLKLFIDTWQKLAKENGLNGIHFVAKVQGVVGEERKEDYFNSGVDASAYSNLAHAERSCGGGKLAFYFKKFKSKILHIGYEGYSYQQITENILNDTMKLDNIYPEIVPQLDFTPRKGNSALILKGSTPELFQNYLTNTINHIQHKSQEHRIILLNAWNEWGEGSYVEPDQKFGRGYLDAIRKAIY